MNAVPTDIRARIAREINKRDRTEWLRSVNLRKDDKRAATASALFGHPGAPDDFGAEGDAAVSRPRHIEAADGEHTTSYARKGNTPKRVRYSCECHLDALKEKGLISEDDWATGIRFRIRWKASAHASRVSSSYGERTGSTSSLEEAEYRSDARYFVDQALEPLSAAERRAVVAVCGNDEQSGLRLPTLIRALPKVRKVWERK